jgi:hypothetical protein
MEGSVRRVYLNAYDSIGPRTNQSHARRGSSYINFGKSLTASSKILQQSTHATCQLDLEASDLILLIMPAD